jgi:hypothetical protein
MDTTKAPAFLIGITPKHLFDFAPPAGKQQRGCFGACPKEKLITLSSTW